MPKVYTDPASSSFEIATYNSATYNCLELEALISKYAKTFLVQHLQMKRSQKLKIQSISFWVSVGGRRLLVR